MKITAFMERPSSELSVEEIKEVSTGVLGVLKDI